MTTYYKATRPDGRDFYSGTVNYAAALETGEVLRHPGKRVKDDPSTYFSVSVAPADCTGFSWPCRLFRVKPVGRAIKATNLPNKRCASALRVVDELPAWQAFGPNGEAVVAHIERCKLLTADEVAKLAAAWAAAWDAARAAAWAAAWDAAWDAARAAAGDAAGDAAWDAARDAAWDAAWALVVRDLITPEQFDALYGPWASVMEVTA